MAKKPIQASFEAGDLRQRVALQQDLATTNSSGGKVSNWQTIANCSRVPARITYPPPSKKGDEQITQQQKHSAVFTTITIRYRPSLNINAAQRVLFGTRVFDIRTVLPIDEYKQEVTLQCEEIFASGTLH